MLVFEDRIYITGDYRVRNGSTGVGIGSLYIDECWVFTYANKNYEFSSDELRRIADKLDELNNKDGL